jgi:hypothetical protein
VGVKAWDIPSVPSVNKTRNLSMKHMLWNMLSTERCIPHMQVLIVKFGLQVRRQNHTNTAKFEQENGCKMIAYSQVEVLISRC